MASSNRKANPERLIIPTVIAAKADAWNASTREVAETDAQRVLEALIAEYGVDGAKQALTNHGFAAESYGYLLTPLYAEATKRRQRTAQSRELAL
jgi:hypothetical protein